MLFRSDPIQTVNGTNTIRVWQYDHGMPEGSKVNIKGISSAVNGIPAAEINGEKTIANVDMDSYTFTTTTSATKTGYAGGKTVYATKNVQYDLLMPTVEVQNFSETNATFKIKTISGKSVDGGQTAYTVDSTSSACLNKQNNYFTTPRMIASEVNETNSLAGGDSLTFTAYISSVNDSLSPVIDTARASLVAVNNKLNWPSETNTNVAALDLRSQFTGATGSFTLTNLGTLWSSGATGITIGSQYYYGSNLYTVVQGGSFGSAAPTHTAGRSINGTAILEYSGNCATIQSTNAAIRALMPNLNIGKYITISGTTAVNGTFLVTGYKDDGTTGNVIINTTIASTENSVTGSTVQLRELFIDDIAPVGSTTYSTYVTTPVKLKLSSTFMKVRFAANCPTGSRVDMYYKTCTGDSKQLPNTKYTLATPVGAGLTNVEFGDNTFYDVDYALDNMSPFDTIVVKLVMKSTNSCAAPRIKDLRIIACA